MKSFRSVDEWGLDPQFSAFRKLMISDIKKLDVLCRLSCYEFYFCGRSIQRVELIGTVVAKTVKSKRIVLHIDDTSGVIQCVRFCNDVDDPKYLPLTRINLGDCVLVRGRVIIYNSEFVIHSIMIEVSKSPNAEVHHWVTALHLREKVYSNPIKISNRVPLAQCSCATHPNSILFTLHLQFLHCFCNFNVDRWRNTTDKRLILAIPELESGLKAKIKINSFIIHRFSLFILHLLSKQLVEKLSGSLFTSEGVMLKACSCLIFYRKAAQVKAVSPFQSSSCSDWCIERICQCCDATIARFIQSANKETEINRLYEQKYDIKEDISLDLLQQAVNLIEKSVNLLAQYGFISVFARERADKVDIAETVMYINSWDMFYYPVILELTSEARRKKIPRHEADQYVSTIVEDSIRALDSEYSLRSGDEYFLLNYESIPENRVKKAWSRYHVEAMKS